MVDTGYRYLLDLRLDDQPVWLTHANRPAAGHPVQRGAQRLVDMIGRSASAREFAEMIVDEFAELLAAAAARRW